MSVRIPTCFAYKTTEQILMMVLATNSAVLRQNVIMNRKETVQASVINLLSTKS
jgi:hypothetical protein